MQMQLSKFKRPGNSSGAAFTIAEMVICFAIVGLVIGGTLTAYTNTAIYTERAGYQLAAQCLAVQQVERVRAALWDNAAIPPIDQTTNLPACTTNLLELPIAGTNAIYATNTLSITTITVTTNPPTYVKMISVTTTWPWHGGVLTNIMVSYRAPDQ